MSRLPIACLLGLLAAAAAAEPAAAGDRAAFLGALAGSPAVQAAQARLQAAQRSEGAAGRLPDPMLGAGYARKSTSMDAWPMYDLAIEQPLPRWGERDARRQQARAETALGAAALREALGDGAAEAAGMLAEAAAARRRAALTGEAMDRATALQALLAARSAAGRGALAEELALRSRLAALAVERDTRLRQAEDAEQEARGLLGLADDAPLPPFAAPAGAEVAIDRVPGLLAARARALAAEGMGAEAHAGRYPETALGLRYEHEAQPGEAMDTVGLEVRIALPIWQGAAADLEDAARAQRRAAAADAEAWRLRARTLLGRAERAAAVARSARAAALGTHGRLQAEYQALERAAAAGGDAGLGLLFDILDRLSEAEGQVVEAEAAARLADAGLWRLAPPDPADLPPFRSQP